MKATAVYCKTTSCDKYLYCVSRELTLHQAREFVKKKLGAKEFKQVTEVIIAHEEDEG